MTHRTTNNLVAQDIEHILSELEMLVEYSWRTVLTVFRYDAMGECMKASNQSGHSQSQSDFMYTLSWLKQNRIRVEQDAPRLLASTLINRFAEEASGGGRVENTPELSVFSNDDLERHLKIKNIIIDAQNDLKSRIILLNQFFSILAGKTIDEKNNPIGPLVLTQAFYEAIDSTTMPKITRPVLYSAFDRALNKHLKDIYRQMIDFFLDAGFITGSNELDITTLPAERLPQTKPTVEQAQIKTSSRSAPLSTPAPSQSTRNQSIPVATKNTGSLHAIKELNKLLLSTQEDRSTSPRGSFKEIGATEGSRGIKDIEAIAHSRLWSHQDEMSQTEKEPSVALGEDSAFNKNQVDNALNKLSCQGSNQEPGKTPLTDLVIRQLVALYPDNAARKLADIHTTLIGIVDNLFRAIANETNLSSHVKQWISQLRIPFVKIVLDDPTFVDDPNNLPRQVLNQLVQLGTINSNIKKRLEEELTVLFSAINQDDGRRYDALVKMNEALKQILNRQEQAFNATAQRVAHACEGIYQIEVAKEFAHHSINDILGGQRASFILMDVIEQGWQRNLTLLALKSGADSEKYKENVQALSKLHHWLIKAAKNENTPNSEQQVDELIAFMNRSLVNTFGNKSHAKLLEQIRDMLLMKTEQDFFNVPEPWSNPPRRSNRPPPIKEIEPTLERWIQRAKEIEINTWIHATVPEVGEQNLQLVWANEARFCFVFANKQGIKQFDLDLKTLAEGLSSGAVSILDDVRIPFVSRVLQNILDSAHTQVKARAACDSLTGLLNRYEFEKRLHRALTSATSEETEHVMCYFDIDQFKLINTSLGTDVGDSVLKKTAEILSTNLPENASLARIGGNEFGLLLEDCDIEVGHAFAERVRKTMQKTHFEECAEHAVITLSIGLVHVNVDSTTVSSILQQAAEAADQAKTRGRNRVRCYMESESDRRLRNQALNWIAKIDKSLDQDWLHLKAQKIMSVKKDEHTLPHYEILLGVKDDNDAIIPVVHFIEAAEKYNRMPKVDRWVVNSTLKWMSENSEAVEKIDGLSINLSGQSINDDSFLEFLSLQMRNTPVPQEKICFEVTETAAIESLTNAADFVKQIRQTGCKFSLDDFGTGMSSYEYLAQLPVDYLKIDGVFIKDIATNKTNYGLVKSVNEIAHLMGKETIAEFVENEEIMAILEEIGIDHVQGWGIEKPRPLSSLG